MAIVAAIAIVGNTDLNAPPRFDGAGYAVLGDALANGQGYREIDHPDRPRHAHFPPGYPAVLALLWCVVGRSFVAAHVLSLICTVAATLVGWWWFRTLYAPRVACLLGLALALNWTWGRNGAAIQAEPLYCLLEMVAVLLAIGPVGDRGLGAAAWICRGIVLGLVLGACILTRHVGVCLALALGLDLWLRRPRIVAISAGLVTTLLLLFWVSWLAIVQRDTQVELLAEGGLAPRVVRQTLFYLQRIPDQLTGPAVEIGTVFRSSPAIFALANFWAVLASCLVLGGWLRTLRNPRRRVAGLVPLATLALLLAWPFTEAGRFLIPLVPFILVGAVEGLATVASHLRLRRPRRWAAAAILAASIPYSVYAIAKDRAGAHRQTYRDFDAACAWIVKEGQLPGPILTRHPGEVYWLTGRQALAPRSKDSGAIDRAIIHYKVAYLLIDDERYARAPANPLLDYVARHPERVRRVWHRETGPASIAVFAVVPREARVDQIPSLDHNPRPTVGAEAGRIP